MLQTSNSNHLESTKVTHLCNSDLTQNVLVNATRCMSGVAKDGFAKVLSVGDADAENELNEVFLFILTC